MPGGLIEIATYGSQDLYLTGTPEITFFKVVYRRHTNFAIESIRLTFDDEVGFGTKSSVTVPKIADLIHKGYLEVRIPRIELFRKKSKKAIGLAKDVYAQAMEHYNVVIQFMALNRRAYLEAYANNEAHNTFTAGTTIAHIQDIFQEPGDIVIVNEFKNVLATTLGIPYIYDEVSVDVVASKFVATYPKNPFFLEIQVAIDKSIILQNFFFQKLHDAKKTWKDAKNAHIKFAWVKRLGHAIFESIEITIGGFRIDRHTSDWLNIWYELTANRSMTEVYDKLIGDIEELTSFDRTPKEAYLLRIPLQFWFNRFSGLALPIIALEYHEVTFNVQFRKLEDVAYVEKTPILDHHGEHIALADVPCELKLDIEAALLLDFVYLDSPERRRFAQSSHEYLIDQLQMLELEEVAQPQVQCVLNNFVHPSKELIWVAQKVEYVENPTGIHDNQWYNYSLTPDNIGHPITHSSIDFNSYNRVPRWDSHYFNYVQPFEVHNTTPSDGVNVYSFSLFPEEHQPSGSANFSRISRVSVTLDFDPSICADAVIPYNIRFYTRNINILRFTSGLSGLAFTYG